jgi:hypothetical protein
MTGARSSDHATSTVMLHVASLPSYVGGGGATGSSAPPLVMAGGDGRTTGDVVRARAWLREQEKPKIPPRKISPSRAGFACRGSSYVHTLAHRGDRHAPTSRPGGPRYRRRCPDPHHGDTAGPSLHPALLGVAGRTRRRNRFAILEQPTRAEQQPATPAGHERPVQARRPASSPAPRTAAATALSASQPEPVAHALSRVSSLATPDAGCRVGDATLRGIAWHTADEHMSTVNGLRPRGTEVIALYEAYPERGYAAGYDEDAEHVILKLSPEELAGLKLLLAEVCDFEDDPRLWMAPRDPSAIRRVSEKDMPATWEGNTDR